MADIIIMKSNRQRAKPDNCIEQTARLLLDTSVKTLMQMYDMDCETARQIVVTASENLPAE